MTHIKKCNKTNVAINQKKMQWNNNIDAKANILKKTTQMTMMVQKQAT
jgi:hypothetical protein